MIWQHGGAASAAAHARRASCACADSRSALRLQDHADAAECYAHRKRALIRELQQFEHDTGTMPVQIGLLTERIRYLTAHTEEHKKDKSSRRGLMILLSRRKKQLKYLRKKDFDAYVKVRAPARCVCRTARTRGTCRAAVAYVHGCKFADRQSSRLRIMSAQSVAQIC
jgi:small subunit ribosomal protein S15